MSFAFLKRWGINGRDSGQFSLSSPVSQSRQVLSTIMIANEIKRVRMQAAVEEGAGSNRREGGTTNGPVA